MAIDILAVHPSQFLPSYVDKVPLDSTAFGTHEDLGIGPRTKHPPLSQWCPLDYQTVEVLPAILGTYQDRIRMLCRDGEVDGIVLNHPSERDFFLFITSAPYTRRASLVLTDNGNLRAVWRGDGGSQLGVQFRGDQWASYVIFKRRHSRAAVSRVCGTDTLEGVERQVRALGVQALLNE